MSDLTETQRNKLAQHCPALFVHEYDDRPNEFFCGCGLGPFHSPLGWSAHLAPAVDQMIAEARAEECERIAQAIEARTDFFDHEGRDAYQVSVGIAREPQL